MRVLYFHQHFSTPRGAAGTRSYRMARALIESNHQVTMICGSYRAGQTGLDGAFRNGQRNGLVDGINIIEFDLAYSNRDGFIKRSLTFLRFAIRSIKIALTYPCDIIFATTTPLTAGLPGIAARWLRGRPFVFEVRDLWPELPKAMGVIRSPLALWALGVLEWVNYHSATHCIALAPGISTGIRARGIEADRISVLPNGCDFQLFGTTGPRWRPTGVNNTDFMAVFTGTHGLANGLHSALDAAAELKSRQRDDIKIVLVGDGAQKQELMNRASTENLTNIVFHDLVGKERLFGLLASADLGLQLLANVPAFYYGTSPNKFFDYLAAGLPVLTNYPGWVSDLIGDAGCGFTVQPENSAAFADALQLAATDRTALKVMRVRATELARQFDLQIIAQDFVATLERAARSESPSHDVEFSSHTPN